MPRSRPGGKTGELDREHRRRTAAPCPQRPAILTARHRASPLSPANWQTTGVYARPGDLLAVVVPPNAGSGLFVVINEHTDELTTTSGNVKADGEFKRPPRESLRVPLRPGVNAVRSLAGGSVILESTRDVAAVTQIEIYGGVEQARYVAGVTSAVEWQRRRALSPPWAVIEGARAVLVVPTAQIVALERPEEVTARYDALVAREIALSGLDGSAPVHRPYDGKHWFVTDHQISDGYGHAGFRRARTCWLAPGWPGEDGSCSCTRRRTWDCPVLTSTGKLAKMDRHYRRIH